MNVLHDFLFREILRAPKPGGEVVIADVMKGSPVAHFLDEFVDRNTVDGHKGHYLASETLDSFREAQFQVRSQQYVGYPWVFTGAKTVVDYCRKLSGLSATDDAILTALDTTLGIQEGPSSCFF